MATSAGVASRDPPPYRHSRFRGTDWEFAQWCGQSQRSLIMDVSPAEAGPKCGSSDFSIERILSGGPRGAGGGRGVAPGWLCCTRYRPPRIPRTSSGSARRAGRHARVPFTSAQAAALEAAYARAPYLAPPELRVLAAALQLRDDRIKIWFQNRRARERREQCAVIPPPQPPSAHAGRERREQCAVIPPPQPPSAPAGRERREQCAVIPPPQPPSAHAGRERREQCAVIPPPQPPSAHAGRERREQCAVIPPPQPPSAHAGRERREQCAVIPPPQPPSAPAGRLPAAAGGSWLLARSPAQRDFQNTHTTEHPRDPVNSLTPFALTNIALFYNQNGSCSDGPDEVDSTEERPETPLDVETV